MTSVLDPWDHHRQSLPTLNLPVGPVLVVVPHPDDESLSNGALLHELRVAGQQVTVIAVTDGEQAYPGHVDPEFMATVREHEQVRALAHLGVDPAHIHRLRIPDGQVAANEDELANTILTHAEWHRAIVSTWSGDHHTDHEACGRAARGAAATVGATLLQGLFWTYHHRSPDVLDGLDVRALPVDERADHQRQQAIACHESQVTEAFCAPAMLQESHLRPTRWAQELYITEELS